MDPEGFMVVLIHMRINNFPVKSLTLSNYIGCMIISLLWLPLPLRHTDLHVREVIIVVFAEDLAVRGPESCRLGDHFVLRYLDSS